MAAVRNGWVTFAGNYACRLADIAYVYEAAAGVTRIILTSGGEFHVNETYADVMRAIVEASA